MAQVILVDSLKPSMPNPSNVLFVFWCRDENSLLADLPTRVFREILIHFLFEEFEISAEI